MGGGLTSLDRWCEMSVEDQIGNIGSEVHRALRLQKKGDGDAASRRILDAMNLLALCQMDEKNIHRTQEFAFLMTELIDYFNENVLNTTEEQLLKTYDQFI